MVNGLTNSNVRLMENKIWSNEICLCYWSFINDGYLIFYYLIEQFNIQNWKMSNIISRKFTYFSTYFK